MAYLVLYLIGSNISLKKYVMKVLFISRHTKIIVLATFLFALLIIVTATTSYIFIKELLSEDKRNETGSAANRYLKNKKRLDTTIHS